jgi:hypothetical protein
MQSFFFTQCACVLFDRPPALGDLERALDAWVVASPQTPAAGDDGWMACGPGFVVELRSGTGVVVDVLDRPWPDDPRAAVEVPALGMAWRAGMFGPSAAPGALARAKEQRWAWEEGAAAADRHRAVVRMRTVIDMPQEGPRELPKGHDPVHELTTLTEMAGSILRLDAATAFFLPGGEALRSPEQVEAAVRRKTGVGPPPLELWTNLRAFGLGQEGDAKWVVADVVGMRQLRLPDQEALFADGQEDPDAVAQLLTNACLHMLGGKPIPNGSTSDDGHGRRWKASATTGVLAPVDRPVLRWTPEESAKPPEALLARLKRR